MKKPNANALHAIVNLFVDGILLIDEQGVIQFANASAVAMLGRESEDLIGSHFEWPTVNKPTEITVPSESGGVTLEMRAKEITWEGESANLVSLRDITEQKNQENEIRAQKGVSENLIEAAQAIILFLDMKGKIVRFNPFFEEATGFSLEEVQGKDWFDTFIPEHERERVRDLFHLAIDDAPTKGNVNEVLTKDGGTIFIEWHDRILKDGDGKDIGLLAIGHNITEKLESDRELSESNLRLREAVKSGNVGLWDWDLETNTVQYSPEWKKQIGYEEHEIGDDFAEWESRVHPEDLKKALEVVDRAIANQSQNYRNEFRFRHKNGSYRWILAQGSVEVNEDGKPFRLMGSHIDITHQKEAEARLEAQSQQLVDVGRMAQVGGWEYDVETGQVKWSKVCREIHEVPEDYELTLDKAFGFFPEFDQSRLKQAFDQAVREGKPYDLIIQFVTHKGRHLWTHTRCNPIVENGKTVKLLGAFQDITKQKEAELALFENERLLKLITNNMFDLVSTANLEGKVIYASPSHKAILGYEPEYLTGRDVTEFVHPEDLPLVLEKLQIVVEKHQPQSVEHRLKTEDGDYIWLESMGKLIHDENGKTQGMIFSSRDITERKKHEQILRQEKDKSQHYLDIAGVILLVLDKEGRISMINRKGCEVLQCEEGEAIGINWFDTFIPESERATIKGVFSEIIKGNISPFESIEKPTLTREGNERIISWNNSVIRNENGEIFGTLSSGEDVTEKIGIHRRLVESESRLKEAQQIALLGYWELNLDTMIPVWSEEIFNIFGLDPNVGEPTFAMHEKVTHVDDWPILNHAVLRAIEIGEPFDIEFRILRPDGKIRWMNAIGNVTKNVNKEVRRVFGTAQDVTERKLAEIEIDKLADVVRNMPVGLHMYHLENPDEATSLRLIATNPTAEVFTGIPGRDLLGKKILENFPAIAEKRLHEKYVEVIRTGQVFEIEDLQYSDDRLVGAFSVIAIPLPDQCVGILFENITEKIQAKQEKEQLEQQFIQSQKMESIGRLAGGIAHDFNNLLTAIQGYSQFISDSLYDNDPIKKDITEIQKAAETASSLTRQLLAFSRKQITDPIVVNLNDQLKKASNMLKRLIGEDIELVFTPNVKLDPVKIDAGQVDQILMNLAINAKHAMPNGGKLTIETQNVLLESEQAFVRKEDIHGEFVLLAVSDTGCGIPPDTIKEIFEPFFTTKPQGEGTGLGLSTVYGIVKQNGGYISVYSEPEQGTSFKIYLPKVNETVETRAIPRDTGVYKGDETVLLVEDRDVVRNLVKRVLENYGYKVLWANDGEDALHVCTKNKDDIDLVLTDVVMPKMSGKELYLEISKIIPGLKIIYMSGYTSNAIQRHGVLEEGTNFIQKPFRPEELAKKVRQVLDSDEDIGEAHSVLGKTVLFIDDDLAMLVLLKRYAREKDINLYTATTGQEGIELFQKHWDEIAMVFCDVNLPDIEGGLVAGKLMDINSKIPIVTISGAPPEEIRRKQSSQEKLFVMQKPTRDLKTWFIDTVKKFSA